MIDGLYRFPAPKKKWPKGHDIENHGRRKFRNQTSDNMERWKSSQQGEESEDNFHDIFPLKHHEIPKDPPGQRPSLSVPWRRLVARPELLRCRLVAYEEPVERLVLSAMDTLKGRKLEDAGNFGIFLWKSWIFLWFSMEFPKNQGHL